MNATRQVALGLLTEPNITPAHLAQAAGVINALLDVIEMQRGAPLTEPIPTPDLQPLRELRLWHHVRADNAHGSVTRKTHLAAVEYLNRYFPKDDQL